MEITDSRDNVTPVANIGDVVTLPAGNYSASAVYGSLSDEGFDKPCFMGTQTFTVIGGQTGMYHMPQAYCTEMYVIAILMLIMAFYRHRGNIDRLIHGNERKIYLTKKNKLDVPDQQSR